MWLECCKGLLFLIVKDLVENVLIVIVIKCVI